MLKKLLDWIYDMKTARILRKACDGDLRLTGKAPDMSLRLAKQYGKRHK